MHIFKEQCYCHTRGFLPLSGLQTLSWSMVKRRGLLVHCNDGLSCVASLKKPLLCLYLSLSLSLSLPPYLPVGFSCWQEGLWSLTGSAQALMLSLPIQSESSRPSSSCKWADTGAGRCTEWWGQGHLVRPHAQHYTCSATGWWCAATSHVPSMKYEAFSRKVFTLRIGLQTVVLCRVYLMLCDYKLDFGNRLYLTAKICWFVVQNRTCALFSSTEIAQVFLIMSNERMSEVFSHVYMSNDIYREKSLYIRNTDTTLQYL